MFGKKTTPRLVGIDIQKNCIRYCTKKGDRLKYGELAVNGTIFKDDKLRNPDSLSAAFNEIAKRLGMRSMNVVITALNSRLLIKQVPIGNMNSEKEIREHLYFELGESITLPFENPIFDLLILARSKKQKMPKVKAKRKDKNADKGEPQTVIIQRNRFTTNGNVPVVVTSEPILIELGDVLKKGGHQLLGVDCSFLAYGRMFHRQINWSENFVLVELDAGIANITFFEELVPTYLQYEDYNQANWKYFEKAQTVQVSFRESAEVQALEGLAETINSVIEYFNREISPNCELSKIYLAGGHPMLRKEVQQIFQETASLPVKTLVAKMGQTNKKKIPDRYVLAAGLAMKEV